MTDKAWYDKPLRIAALQCNFEDGKNFEVIDKWTDMGFNVEQLFHPTADLYSALFDEAAHGEIVAEYVDRAHQAGLRIILYLNCHVLGPSLAPHAADWAQRRPDGEFRMMYDGVYHACCINSPFRDHFLSILDALAAYDIDGVFLDGPMVPGDGCFCESCRQRARDRTGEDLEALADRADFNRDSMGDFLRDSYAHFKAGHPDGVHYMNFPVMHPTSSFVPMPEALAYNDIVATEGGFMFYQPPRQAQLWKPGTAARVLEAVGPDKPRVIFMAADQKPWSWYLHTPAETRLCIASTVANGASIWYGLHGSTRLLPSPGGRAAREMLRFLRRNEAYYDGAAADSRVAVLYSYDTEKAYRTTAEASDFYGAGGEKPECRGDFSQAFAGLCESLCGSGIPFEVVSDLDLTAEALSRYECLLLPTCACLSDASVEAIREFVARGGTVVASFECALYREDGTRREDFALADVFGLHAGRDYPALGSHNFLSLTQDHPLLAGIDIPLLPSPDTAIDVEPDASAVVLARFHAAMQGRYAELTDPAGPAVVLHDFGKGRSVFLAGTFAETLSTYAHVEYRALLENAVRLYAPGNVSLAGASGNVEVVVRRQGARRVVHLVNHLGATPRPFRKIMRQDGLQLRVPGAAAASSARALRAGIHCAIRPDGDAAVVDLPGVDEYEVVVVE